MSFAHTRHALVVAAAAMLACQPPAPAPGSPGAEAAAAELPACAPPVEAGPAGAPSAPLPPLGITIGAQGEPAPVGEVAFSHRAHAGDCKIPCLACHVFATQSPVAGIPSGRKCMGCHKFVAKEKLGVRILAARVKAEQPLRWERVFVVPDFIYFSHRAHLRIEAKADCKDCEKVECKDCHGDVASQKVVRQETPFTMGMCLGCHEKKRAPRGCTVCHK